MYKHKHIYIYIYMYIWNGIVLIRRGNNGVSIPDEIPSLPAGPRGLLADDDQLTGVVDLPRDHVELELIIPYPILEPPQLAVDIQVDVSGPTDLLGNVDPIPRVATDLHTSEPDVTTLGQIRRHLLTRYRDRLEWDVGIDLDDHETLIGS